MTRMTATLPAPPRPGADQRLGETTTSRVSVQLHTVDGHDLCRVHVPPSTFQVEAHLVVDQRGQLERKTAFYVRIGNATREITYVTERQRYVQQR